MCRLLDYKCPRLNVLLLPFSNELFLAGREDYTPNFAVIKRELIWESSCIQYVYSRREIMLNEICSGPILMQALPKEFGYYMNKCMCI